MNVILAQLSKEARGQVVVRIARLERLPESVVQNTALEFARLMVLKARYLLRPQAAATRRPSLPIAPPHAQALASAAAAIPPPFRHGTAPSAVSDALARITQIVNNEEEARILKFLHQESLLTYLKLNPAAGPDESGTTLESQREKNQSFQNADSKRAI
jgi:hypothetical protein